MTVMQITPQLVRILLLSNGFFYLINHKIVIPVWMLCQLCWLFAIACLEASGHKIEE